MIVAENGLVWLKNHFCARLPTRFHYVGISNQHTLFKLHLSPIAISKRVYRKVFAQGIRSLCAHSIQPYRFLKCLAIILSSCVYVAHAFYHLA